MADSSSSSPILVWFRRDLRLHDHPALTHAAATGRPVIPCFVWAPDEEAPWPPGAASRWWLHHSLTAFRQALTSAGLDLVIRQGPTLETLRELVRETGAGDVVWTRLYEPAVIERDKRVKAALTRDGVNARSFSGHLLHEPWAVLTQQDKPYQVFTPYYRACRELGDPDTPFGTPNRIVAPDAWPPQAEVNDLGLLPAIDWAGGLRDTWTPGEAGAVKALDAFARDGAAGYVEARDLPAEPGTSRLSPHLHFGEVSPRRVWATCAKVKGSEPYLRQLVWRDFGHQLLYHFPHTPEKPLREEFARFPWRPPGKAFTAWCRGQTGYPIVDAGMRELWTTGWMHNRVRMIVASFLVKDLRVSWLEGARWFWDTLVDADLANNTLGWQWAGGCGADAAPYFRIFNPDLQSKKFDSDGVYLRRWVPELDRVPVKRLHAAADLGSWEDRPDAYPRPMVDHRAARQAALDAFHRLKND